MILPQNCLECGVSDGDNRHRLEKKNTQYTDTQIRGEWVPRISIGFTKFFDAGNYTDRIELNGELYYNDAGYEENMLADEEIKGRFLQGGCFKPGNYGKYYAAIFSRYGKFLVSDMALKLSAIGNLSDSSFILSSELEYQLTNDALLNFRVSGHSGEKNRGYTLSGNVVSAEIFVNLTF